MAGWSFALDPVTKDMIPDGKGSFVRTFNADTHALLQLDCVAGECWQDELLGSRLSKPQLFAANPVVLVPDEIKRAYGVLQTRGLVTNIQAAGAQTAPGRVDVDASFRNVSTGQVSTQFFEAGG